MTKHATVFHFLKRLQYLYFMLIVSWLQFPTFEHGWYAKVIGQTLTEGNSHDASRKFNQSVSGAT